ncbi:AbrB/MazE/SpoVT family DNA-binding domain-containing protein [Streptomyces sp. NPDC058322]|uniref:AbrB/MazE/SpoVT family DNA-binding domain-containing protein n=1 Tax=unclassified Streptomyces TaxID=2593676 RepID=UPI0036EEF859
MIREPAETTVSQAGIVEIPLGVLAEAGLSPGAAVVVYSDGDGRIVVRRKEDAIRDLLENGSL